MPIRSIPLSHSSVTGRLASRPGHASIKFEFSLERDFAILQLFDYSVLSVEEQPVRIDYKAPSGKPTRSRIPSFSGSAFTCVMSQYCSTETAM